MEYDTVQPGLSWDEGSRRGAERDGVGYSGMGAEGAWMVAPCCALLGRSRKACSRGTKSTEDSVVDHDMRFVIR